MTWQPGRPVATAQDHAEWEAWRKESKREQQRWRRARYPRIDYYPSEEAAEIIRSMVEPRAGGDYSSVLNRIVEGWAASGATGIE